jgi:hypothetical protein
LLWADLGNPVGVVECVSIIETRRPARPVGGLPWTLKRMPNHADSSVHQAEFSALSNRKKISFFTATYRKNAKIREKT